MINEDKSIEKVIDAAVASLENSSLVQEKEIIVVGKDALSKQMESLRANYHDLQIYISHSRAYFPEIANKGLFKATGDIIVLLTEDTLLPTDYFDVIIPQFEKTNIFAAESSPGIQRQENRHNVTLRFSRHTTSTIAHARHHPQISL